MIEFIQVIIFVKNLKPRKSFVSNVLPAAIVLSIVLSSLLQLPETVYADSATFNSSTTWTAPADVCEVTAQVWGAGGGGGAGGSNNAGSGGGGGAYARSILSVQPGTEYTVTVGTGGGATQNGGASWFVNSETVYASGGNGGANAAGAAGAGGNVKIGDGGHVFNGGNGAVGADGGGPPQNRLGGGGGGSAFTNANGNNASANTGGTGTGNGGNGTSGGTAGNPGNAPGAGGAGGGNTGAGGAGAAGRVVLTFFTDPGCADDSVVAISGIVYTDEGTTPMAAGRTVRLKVNGAGEYTGTTNSSGEYNIEDVVAGSGNVITIYLDGATEKAVTVTRADDSDITNLDLYQNHVIIRSEDGSPLTNTNLDQYDSGQDNDIQFTVTTNNLTVPNGQTLYLPSGTYTPGGNMTFSETSHYKQVGGTFNGGSHTKSLNGNFTLTDGTYNATSATFSQSGNSRNFNISGGTFNHNDGTVAFIGNAHILNLDQPVNFYNLTVNIANPLAAWTLNGTAVVHNLLSYVGGVMTGATGEVHIKKDAASSSGQTQGGVVLVFNGTGDQVFTGTGTGQTPAWIIDKPSGVLTVTGAVSVSRNSFTGLDYVQGDVDFSDSTFYFRGANQTINSGSLEFNNVVFTLGNPAAWKAISGTMHVKGDLDFLGDNPHIQGGTIRVGGNVSTTDPTMGGSSTTQLTLDGTGDQTITAGGANRLPQGTLTIDKPSGSVILATDLTLANTQAFNITSGTFDHGAEYNLTAGAVTVGEDGVWTNTGTGNITLGGNVTNSGSVSIGNVGESCGGADNILIRSTVNGTQRTWSGSGAFYIADVDVQDMAGSMTAYSSTNNGNTAWTFVADCPVTISGTVYTDEGETTMGAGRTVRLKVNGDGDYSATLDSGTYSISEIEGVEPGDVITVYLDNATEKAVTITRALGGSTNINNLNLYQNHLIVRHQDVGPITNDNIGSYEATDDVDLPFTVSGGNLSLGSGMGLLVRGTYTPNGSVTTAPAGDAASIAGDVIVVANGTLNMGVHALSVGGDLIFDPEAGFSADPGHTIYMTSTADGHEIQMPLGEENYQNLVFDGSGSWTYPSGLAIDGSLQVNNGTLVGDPAFLPGEEPEEEWVASEVASDDFNRENGSLGANWTSTGAIIVDNQARQSPNSTSYPVWAADDFGNNQYAQATFVSGSPASVYRGLLVRASSDAANAYGFRCAGSAGCQFIKRVNFGLSTLQSVGVAISSNEVVRLEVIGNTLYLYQNGALTASYTDNDNPITSGRPGFVIESIVAIGGSARLDDWSGGNMVLADPPPGPSSDPALLTVRGGSITGDGEIAGGSYVLEGSGTFGTNAEWTFNSLVLGDGVGEHTTTAAGDGRAIFNRSLTVAGNHTFDAGELTLEIRGLDADGGPSEPEESIMHISAGDYSTCAVSSQSYVYCWGTGDFGQLGYGDPWSSQVPVRVLAGEAVGPDTDGTYLANIVQVAHIANLGSWSNDRACALSAAGNVYCWGRGNNGQLGNGGTSNSSVPVRVLAGEAVGADTDGTYLTNIKQISAGGSDLGCAVSNSSNLYCWGGGDPTTVRRVMAGEAIGADTDGTYLVNVKQIAVGHQYQCAVSNLGNAYCWGNGANGQIGNGETSGIFSTPVRVLAGEATGTDSDGTYLTNIAQMDVNYVQTCAVSNAGYAYCWGLAGAALGNGTTSGSTTPVRVLEGEATGADTDGTYLVNIKQIANAFSTTCAVSNAGYAYCWGDGSALGNGDDNDSSIPVRVHDGEAVESDTDGTYLVNVSQIAGSAGHVCAVSQTGNPYCWGVHWDSNHLGNGSNSSDVPVRVLKGEAAPGDFQGDYLFLGAASGGPSEDVPFEGGGAISWDGSTGFAVIHSVQSDSDYIYLGGYQASGCPTGDYCWYMEKRDKTTGALVEAFGNSGVVQSDLTNSDDAIRSIAIDDSYIYLGGFQSNGAGCSTGNTCWRLEKRDKTTGELVSAFGTSGVVQSDPTSSVDRLNSIAIDSSYIYLGGEQATGAGCSTGGSCWRVEKRDKTTGALVEAFGNSGVVQSDLTSDNEWMTSIAIDDSYIYLGGYQFDGPSSGRVEKRDKTTGALVEAFGNSGIVLSSVDGFDGVFIYRIVIDDSYIYMGGSQGYDSGENCPDNNACWRLEKRDKTTGAFVSAFGDDGVLIPYVPAEEWDWDELYGLAVDGSHVYLGGYQGFDCPTSNTCWRLEKRDKTTGEPVSSFGQSGVVLSDPSASGDSIEFIAIDNSYIYSGGNSGSGGHFERRDIVTGELAATTTIPISPPPGGGGGSIDPVHKYAWGENIGWLNFGTAEGNVRVFDDKLTGYAWGENIGWVSLHCENDNSCGTVDFGVANDGDGNLSGYAWGENVGWLNFAPDGGGVTIDPNTGAFSGYAWGENTGWISFNCTNDDSCGEVNFRVRTTWPAGGPTGPAGLIIEGVFLTNLSTIEYAANSTQPVIDLPYYNLRFNYPGAEFSLPGGLTVRNTLHVAAGTLDLSSTTGPVPVLRNLVIDGTVKAPSSAPLVLSGDFTNNGTFAHNDGTVRFADFTNLSTISGDTTFHNLELNAEGKTIEFGAGQTFTILGVLEMTGADGNPIVVRSATPGEQWFINLQGAANVNHINLRGAGCHESSLPIDLSDKRVINAGGNGACWVIGAVRTGGGAGGFGEGAGSGVPETGGGPGGNGGSGGDEEGSGGGEPEGGGSPGGGGGGDDLGSSGGWKIFAIYLPSGFSFVLN